MNWNIFKRLRAVETDHDNTDASLGVLIERVDSQFDRNTRLINNLILGMESNRSVTDIHLKAVMDRVIALEKSMKPVAVTEVKAAAEKLLKAQAYRRAYYQKKKSEVAADLARAYDHLKGLK